MDSGIYLQRGNGLPNEMDGGGLREREASMT